MAKIINVPNKKAVKDRINIILRFEKPKTLSESKSVLVLIDIKYHIDAIKIINGRSFIIRLGIYIKVSKIGKLIFGSKFLANSISSKRFKIIPRQIKTKIVLIIIFKKPDIKYLFITLFIFLFFPNSIYFLKKCM